MWVNEILPPRVRLSWLLITTRLSIINLAGIARTLVAVGSSSDIDMFFTTAAAAPRNTWTSSPSPGGGAARRVGQRAPVRLAHRCRTRTVPRVLLAAGE